jgi:tetratricopeptide (TPR) repeat protein
MGFRMRKSIKLAPGVRLNVSKRGLGMSAGVGGVRYSVHSSGRRTVSARTGVPGVYYQKSVSRSSRAPRTRARAVQAYSAPPVESPPTPPKPGLFASKAEKELFKATVGRNAADAMAVGDETPAFRLASYTVAGFLTFADENLSMAERLLSQVWALGSDPADDPFITKYARWQLGLQIVEGVTADLYPSRDAIGLALGELYQDQGRLRDAIDVVEHLEPTTYSALSLAELYVLDKQFDKVIELTEGIENEDDATALLLVFRGIAFRGQGFHEAAHETFKQALRSRSRNPTIRHHAMFERAKNYLAQGKKAMARKDLERILAEDSDYEGVRDQLAELGV